MAATVGAAVDGRCVVPGIQNLGNTCFFNAILHALASGSSFGEYLDHVVEQARSKGRAIPFTKALKDCIDELAPVAAQTYCPAIVPRTLNMELCKKLTAFRGNKQQDSQELLQFLINLVHDEQKNCSQADRGLKDLLQLDSTNDDNGLNTNSMLNGSLTGSFFGRASFGGSCSLVSNSISDLRFCESVEEKYWNPLYGLQVDVLQCARCNRPRPMNNQRFLDVSLSFAPSAAVHPPKTVDLYELLRLYTDAEAIDGVECSYCSVKQELERTQLDYEEAGAASKAASTAGRRNDDNPVKNLDAVELEILQHERKEWVHSLQCLLAVSEDQNEINLEELTQRGWYVPRALQPCRKKLLISRTPDILSLHLNRKVFNIRSGSAKRLDTHVYVPLQLDVSEFCFFGQPGGPSATHPPRNGFRNGYAQHLNKKDAQHPLLYELTAVVLHQGNERSGHFTCFRRVPNGQWFHISDETVREASEAEVRLCCAYLLFYERKHRAPRSSSRFGGNFGSWAEADDPFLNGGHIDVS
ncbi:TPA: hypothetical protein N0F65_006245 [Lagenidium giganteum]|uniref:USP domain-containing protein n=1 Tax=Lagenidium giganteum TaxID=4803 RepID=A0AAV2Z4I4_9STRA|nr:TPA: hypothetical protein N0F65_006245 [Lagenidium giganteum]